MRSQHIVGAFDAELQGLSRRIAAMGGMAERMVEEAATALRRGDLSLADHVIASDERLDAAQRELDETVVSLLARRQPLAGDLREIVAALRIGADLERVGDLAKNVAKRLGAVDAGERPRELQSGLDALAEAAQSQLKDVLDAYATRTADRLAPMRDRDREIDTVFTSLFGSLLDAMMNEPRTITASTHLLFCIKNFERIGDHATNIAETVFQMVTGHEMPADRPKADRTHSLSGAA